jgi:hypothetical protein
MFMYASNDFCVDFRGADPRFNSQLAYLIPNPGFWQVKKCAKKIALETQNCRTETPGGEWAG